MEVEVVTVDMDPQPGTDTTLTEDPLPMMTTTDTLPEMTAEDHHQRGDYFLQRFLEIGCVYSLSCLLLNSQTIIDE